MTSHDGQPPPGTPPGFTINVPAEVEEGHYADFASIWHNAETFVLDFAAMTGPARLGHDDAGQSMASVQCRVVARVRIPAVQVWEVIKGLEKQLTEWENRRKTHEQVPPPPESAGPDQDRGAGSGA